MQRSAAAASPSSRGLGHRPFTAVTGVRIPLGTPSTLVLGGTGRGPWPEPCERRWNARLLRVGSCRGETAGYDPQCRGDGGGENFRCAGHTGGAVYRLPQGLALRF